MPPGAVASAGARPLALVGLAALAITQPVLDLMGRNPEFFVAGRYTSDPDRGVRGPRRPRPVRRARRRRPPRPSGPPAPRGRSSTSSSWRPWARCSATSSCAGSALDERRLAIVAAVAGRGGRRAARARPAGSAAAAVPRRRQRPLPRRLPVRQPHQRAAVQPASSADALGTVSVPVPAGPGRGHRLRRAPVATLMRSDGTINAERYPGLRPPRGRLHLVPQRQQPAQPHRAGRAVALTGHGPRDAADADLRRPPPQPAVPAEHRGARPALRVRHRPVPAVGLRATRGAADHPGRRGLVGRVRPPGPPAGAPRDLPPIDDAWGELRRRRSTAAPAAAAPSTRRRLAAGTRSRAGTASPAPSASPQTQAAPLVEQGLAIDADPALHFIHVVAAALPWFATPWGTRLMQPMPDWVEDPAQPALRRGAGCCATSATRSRPARPTSALGQVLDHLEGSALWDDTTLVVVADHGTSTHPAGRRPRDHRRQHRRGPPRARSSSRRPARPRRRWSTTSP